MEKILQFKDGEVTLVREELSLIPEFASMLTLSYNRGFPSDADGKRRLRAKKEFTYMWFMNSYDTPYREYTKDERQVEALLAADLPESHEFGAIYLLAEKAYLRLIETRILKLIKASEMAIDNLRTFLETVDFTKTNENGTLIYKPKEVMSVISDLDKVADGLNRLADRQRTEMKDMSGTRGGQEDGWIMDKNDDSDGTGNSSTDKD